MKFEIYCDESQPDLLTSQKPDGNYMVIGSLWLRADDRAEFKEAIHNLRDEYHIGGEFKWTKISPSRRDFYNRVAQWFMEMGDRLRFRCIAVEQEKVNLIHYHDNDQELGFYKFYYQLIHHWVLDFNEYSIFCDYKSNRRRDRLPVLQRCLGNSNLSSTISNVQAVKSEESVLIQLADLLTGAASARLNNRLAPSSAKMEFVRSIEEGLGRKIAHTYRAEQKFNVFVINLQGGW